MVNKFLVNITPRDYQVNIVNNCKDQNSLIILPTGVGKTLVALMLIIERMQEIPSGKILFLAPTRPLAEQHFEYFKKHLPELFAEMQIFTGKINSEKRKKIWEKTDIIFSTPQCIANDVKKNLYNLRDVSLLIEDEVHRCVKNYSYTYVAQKYNEQSINKRILGLTASPGTNKEMIKTICKNLAITKVELRTRDSPDVKPYLQELEFNTIKVEFPKKFQDIRKLLQNIYQEKTTYLKEKKFLFGPANKVTLLECQRKMMNSLRFSDKSFHVFHGITACTQAIKISHAIELLETQTLYGLQNYLNNQESEARNNKSKSVKLLVSNPNFTRAKILVDDLINNKLEHPKLLELKHLVEQKIEADPKSKIIVFSQYRDSVVKISKELNSLGIKSKVFVGQAKKVNSGLTQKEQQEIIKQFSKSEFNVLCATSIAEEGLDIPEVKGVIFYEPVSSAIRKIQRSGRTARLKPGELIMLITKDTRDEVYYWSSIQKEKGMHKAIDSVKKDLLNNPNEFKDSQTKLM